MTCDTNRSVATDAANWLRQHFARAGVFMPAIVQRDEDYTGDGVIGYVECEGLTMYPVEITQRSAGRPDRVTLGWGVDEAVVVPGRRTLSNGDPGYPDDVDVVTLLPPFTARKSIFGDDVRDPTSFANACCRVVDHVVALRLMNWRESMTTAEYARMSFCGRNEP